MKKLITPALIALIIIQLFVPVSKIINKYDILKTGEEFKFKVSPVDPYDAFRGRYVSITYRQGVTGYGKYAAIVTDADGFAHIDSISDEKPFFGAYVKNNNKHSWFLLPIDRYYMDEKLAPKAETLTRRREPGKETYVTVRIKNGGLVISGFYIDGIAIEDIIRNHQ